MTSGLNPTSDGAVKVCISVGRFFCEPQLHYLNTTSAVVGMEETHGVWNWMPINRKLKAPLTKSQDSQSRIDNSTGNRVTERPEWQEADTAISVIGAVMTGGPR